MAPMQGPPVFSLDWCGWRRHAWIVENARLKLPMIMMTRLSVFVTYEFVLTLEVFGRFGPHRATDQWLGLVSDFS